MLFVIEFSNTAKNDLKKHKKSGQKRLIERIKRFTLECQKHPREGLGKPELLKFRKEETWSRRINIQHRFVYEIDNMKVYVLSVWVHYKDK